MNLPPSFIGYVDSKLQRLWVNRIPQFCEHTNTFNISHIFQLKPTVYSVMKHAALQLSESILHSGMTQSNLEESFGRGTLPT